MINGQPYTVREVGAVSFGEYGKVLAKDRVRATAILLSECVLDEEGLPALEMDDAIEIAKSARVTMPLITAIMEVSGFGGNEKESIASRALRSPSRGVIAPDGGGDESVPDSEGVSRLAEVLDPGTVGTVS